MASTTSTPSRKASSTAKKAAPRKTFKREEVETLLRRVIRRGYPSDARAERAYTRKAINSLLGNDTNA